MRLFDKSGKLNDLQMRIDVLISYWFKTAITIIPGASQQSLAYRDLLPLPSVARPRAKSFGCVGGSSFHRRTQQTLSGSRPISPCATRVLASDSRQIADSN
jgi:hypothetical protein